MPDNLVNIEIGVILSNRTTEGMIDFVIKKDGREIKTQWDLVKAKEIHGMLSGAIEAAVSDTLIWKFLTEKVGLSEDKAAAAMLDFRELRQGTRGVAYPS